jgi:hypothetical protein
MNLKSLFDVRSTNGWILALSVAANLMWSLFTLLIGFYLISGKSVAIVLLQVGLLLGMFIGPFIIGWLCGWLAFDDRGPTYGVIGALGSVAIILVTFLATGGIAILLSIAALAGGFNGGMLSLYSVKNK